MADTQINNTIVLKGAKEHNLKNVDIELPHDKLIVFTGVSGSGKSSLVIDTIYAEGYRRYVESLSSYARQFLERVGKPDVDFISGLRPAIAIEQKSISKNSRSTVGTTTEIYDYLRLMFARTGKTYCYSCDKVVKKDSTKSVLDYLSEIPEGSKFYLAFPLHKHEERTVTDELDLLKKRGYFRIYIKDQLIDLNEEFKIPKTKNDIYIVIERFKVTPAKINELPDSVETAFREGEGRLALINADANIIKKFTKFYECCDITYPEPEPKFFSFNSPFGACPVCEGFGRTLGIDMDLVIPNPNISLADDAIAPLRTMNFARMKRDLLHSAKKYNMPTEIPYSKLTAEEKELIRIGFGTFIGINKFFEEVEKHTYKIQYRVLLSRYRGHTVCHACRGSRLRREAQQIKLGGLAIHELTKYSISATLDFFSNLKLTKYEHSVADRILNETIKRLTFLNEIGLGYLTLDRLSNTLSGGETQRINLATSLGSALTGAMYVLDEPSIGLHSRDNIRLINLLKKLRDLGNTVLVIEHDPEMMQEADIVVDVGPKAGQYGGKITACGTYNEILKNDKSLTGKYLSGKLSIPIPRLRRFRDTGKIEIINASENNLKNIDVTIPLKKFVVITGVSGSGKSTLVHNVIYGNIAKLLGKNPNKSGKCEKIHWANQIDEIEIVDQSPIGKSSRSNPISYVGGFDHIRELFSSTPLARARNYKPGFFSFNVPGGRCETCQGEGFVTVEMQFLADIYIECEDCKGTRFKKEIRDVLYKGKSLVDVLNMPVDEALAYFEGQKKIVNYMKVLSDVGLGYIKVGQPANTLSGGEAQRVKLASHIANSSTKKHTLFIFDEPTTGLHFEDISKLLNCFNLLLEKDNSLIIIEHNMDIIKCADYIIDLGPEAGDNGGEIVATGTPEEIVICKKSVTGQYLKKYLQKPAK